MARPEWTVDESTTQHPIADCLAARLSAHETPASRACDDATEALTRLDRELGVGADLGAVAHQLAWKEAVCAVKIRHPRLILSELVIHALAEGARPPRDDVGEATAYLAALDYGSRLSTGALLAPVTLLELRTRIVANDAAGPAHSEAPVRTAPLPPPRGPRSREGMTTETRDGRSLVLAVAMTVAEIAAMRPFASGNCRLTRLLALLLVRRAYPGPAAVLHPSLYLMRHAARARALVGGGGAPRDPDPWIEFFAGAIASSARASLATIRRLERLARADAASIGPRYAAASALRVHEALRRQPVASVDAILETSGLRIQSAMRAIHRLRALGIVREITGRTRHRIFSYHEYARILGEGTEIVPPLSRG